MKHLDILKDNNFQYPEIELRALLNKTSKLNKEIVLSNFEKKQIDLNKFISAFKRRLKNEPIAKIFQEKEFWKYHFIVNNKVLDPRPESELIIETIEKYFPNKNEKLRIIDIGTGSGCLAITIAKEYINSKVLATDISKLALNVAKKNSLKHKVNKQIQFVKCNWVNILEKFDIVVSNPPYLTDKEYANSSKEIKHYEPKIALKGGRDGLRSYYNLASKIPDITHSESLSFIEIGSKQKKDSSKIFASFGMKYIKIIKDYQNLDRILVLKKTKKM